MSASFPGFPEFSLRFLFIIYVYVCLKQCQVLRAGLNIEIAPDLIANQLNVRNGALVLLVHFCHYDPGGGETVSFRVKLTLYLSSESIPALFRYLEIVLQRKLDFFLLPGVLQEI